LHYALRVRAHCVALCFRGFLLCFIMVWILLLWLLTLLPLCRDMQLPFRVLSWLWHRLMLLLLYFIVVTAAGCCPG